MCRAGCSSTEPRWAGRVPPPHGQAPLTVSCTVRSQPHSSPASIGVAWAGLREEGQARQRAGGGGSEQPGPVSRVAVGSAAGGGPGAAVTAAPSAGCDCSPCGTETCDPQTGRCLCKTGVAGRRCDHCQVLLLGAGFPGGGRGPRAMQGCDHSLCPQEGHFGFEGCGGCQPCACGPAAEGSRCHPQTGQCQCRPGAGGRQCHECAPGHWGRPEQGCRRKYGQGPLEGMCVAKPLQPVTLFTLTSPQAASAPRATVTCTQAAAPVPRGSAGSAVTPAASSTRCPCLAGLGAMASTAKVRPTVPLCPVSVPPHSPTQQAGSANLMPPSPHEGPHPVLRLAEPGDHPGPPDPDDGLQLTLGPCQPWVPSTWTPSAQPRLLLTQEHSRH